MGMEIRKLLFVAIMAMSLSASAYSQTTIDSWIDNIKQCDSEECQKKGLIVLKDSLMRTLEARDFPSECLCKYVNVNLYDSSLKEVLLSNLRTNYDFWTIRIFFKIGDPVYCDSLLCIYKEKRHSKSFIYDLTMENALIRCGNKDILEQRYKYLTEAVKHKGNLDLDFCMTITETRDVADRRYADLLMGYVINNNNQLVYYGDDGGGNVDYCPLSKLSILILKDIIKDFPYVPGYYELIDEKKGKEIQQWCKKHKKTYEMNMVP
ncbi:MAG: hypothetical protein IK131_06720 [Paludibacteraceae bacterium]|nr:hypothetical protein [Paludibacteraceae bacterium]MBR5374345.1 hypothetical protein [Paludibacteraceae bacterium]